MELEGSRPHLQDEPIQFLKSTAISLIYILIVSFHICLGLSRGLFPIGLSVKILKVSSRAF